MVGKFYHKTIHGNFLSQILDRFWTFLFGTADLHSHIRYRNISQYFQNTEKNIEIGAGSGLRNYEF